jgi:Thiamine pyrophosphate enzyme, C-terminal TPP binding domain
MPLKPLSEITGSLFPELPTSSPDSGAPQGVRAFRRAELWREGLTRAWGYWRGKASSEHIVSNNAAWNIERYDQEANYGGRVVGTTLRHSDYAAMARALGAHGERVEDPGRLVEALRRALANAPALVDVVTSQSAISSDARKGLGFVPDFQPLTAWDDAERKRRETK